MVVNFSAGDSKPALTEQVRIGVDSVIVNSSFGVYTDVGDYNRIQNSRLDDYSYTGQWCFLQNTIVRKFSNIAAMVRVGPTAHPVQRASLHHFTYRRRLYGFDEQDDREFFAERESRITTVGHDTWIGHGAIIMPGICIGNGAVVGSGAVVTRDVPAYSIAVGVPARIVKRRFSEEIEQKLTRIAWWDWSYDRIKDSVKDFLLPVEEFTEKHGG